MDRLCSLFEAQEPFPPLPDEHRNYLALLIASFCWTLHRVIDVHIGMYYFIFRQDGTYTQRSNQIKWFCKTWNGVNMWNAYGIITCLIYDVVPKELRVHCTLSAYLRNCIGITSQFQDAFNSCFSLEWDFDGSLGDGENSDEICCLAKSPRCKLT